MSAGDAKSAPAGSDGGATDAVVSVTVVRSSIDDEDDDSEPTQQRCVQCGFWNALPPTGFGARATITTPYRVIPQSTIIEPAAGSKQSKGGKSTAQGSGGGGGNSGGKKGKGPHQVKAVSRMLSAQLCEVCEFPLPHPHMCFRVIIAPAAASSVANALHAKSQDPASSYLMAPSASVQSEYQSTVGDATESNRLPPELTRLIFDYLVWVPPAVGDVIDVLAAGFKWYASVVLAVNPSTATKPPVLVCRYLGWHISWIQEIELPYTPPPPPLLAATDGLPPAPLPFAASKPAMKRQSSFGNYDRIEGFGMRTARFVHKQLGGSAPAASDFEFRRGRMRVFTGSFPETDRQRLKADGYSDRAIATKYMTGQWNGTEVLDSFYNSSIPAT